ncbi:MAG: Rrf2 family transcriptional regulator [Saprospiraceae bacterium]|nr:Rrf2 family transcriptional regulator [Candidatus Vicinibacter affinis]
MIFTRTFSYSIKVLIFLALHFEEGRNFRVKDISEGLDVPDSFLAKILQKLAKNKLIQSHKGPNGGFAFNPSTLKTPLAEIIELTDSKDYLNTCVLNFHACNARNPCPMHHMIGNINAEIRKLLEKTYFEELLLNDRNLLLNQIKDKNYKPAVLIS